MKAAPPIENIEVLDNFEIIIKFEGLSPQIVDLKKFNLLGPKARRLGQDIKYLRSFELVDGVPEWEGLALLGPEDLLEAAQPYEEKIGASFRNKLDAKYSIEES
jgi:hypothetical protein